MARRSRGGLALAVAMAGAVTSCDLRQAWYSGTAEVAVHTGGSGWERLRPDAPLTVFRDNPPMFGRLRFDGAIVTRPFGARDMAEGGTYLSRQFVWDGGEFRFAVADGATWHDRWNDGSLGISHVAPLTPGEVRYHTNGLLLEPGRDVTVALERRRFEGAWRWERVPEAAGALRLDPRTAVVPVNVLIVEDAGDPPRRVTEHMVQLWFDGRTVDRVSQSVSNAGDGVLNSFVVDHDPRTGYAETEPWPALTAGRRDGIVQEIDGIWCLCGARHGKNIQFRLAGFHRVPATAVSARCARPATRGAEEVRSCLGGWRVYAERSAGARPGTLTVAFLPSYSANFAIAQAWNEAGVVVGESQLFGQVSESYPAHVIAHELGHMLGQGDLRFLDGYRGPGGAENLMGVGAPELTREQCDVAYETARRWALYPVPG